ncbi:MAG: hypothetical protein C4575_01915 [Desulforudis sp.]|nr:MAG: hypothetical protein C4575_01915 [Desulforudis sp.]
MIKEDQRGSVLSVEFLIVTIMVVILAFGAMDYWLIQVKAQHAEHIKNYYLDRMRVEGHLTATDEVGLLDRFEDAGFKRESVVLEGTVASLGAARVLRNVADPTTSEVALRVKVQPNTKPFLMGRLLRVDSEGEFEIVVAGRALSERVAE